MILNLSDIEKHFSDGEKVNLQTLYEKKMAKRRVPGGIKILAKGDLTKKVEIEATSFSKKAIEKLESKKIKYTLIGKKSK